MSEAIRAYRHVAASPEFREIERVRSKAMHDEAQALRNAERRERAKWQGVVADKDAVIADKDAVIADKDAALADKDAALADKNTENEQLKQQLAELRSQLIKK